MSAADEARVDVLVAGAGPAGLSAARAASRLGASVLAVDARREIGTPVRCAEFVPRLMAREVDIPDGAVAQAVEEMAVFCECPGECPGEGGSGHQAGRGGSFIELGRVRSPGFILHRERLEASLAESAIEAGAGLLRGTRAAPAGEGSVRLADAGTVRPVRPKVVVAADGPFSCFRPRRQAGRCLPAVQYTLQLKRRTSRTEVYFARRFRFGYAWLFPKGGLANVGVGCAAEGGRRRLIPMLDDFVEGLRRAGKLAEGRPLRRTGGWIPVWGPPDSAVAKSETAEGQAPRSSTASPKAAADRLPAATVGGAASDITGVAEGQAPPAARPALTGVGDILFAGDAAGFTDPVTGAGIWPAIATGGLAGECAARAALEGDVSFLHGYDEAWRDLMGAALSRSAAARRRMEAEWDSRELADLVRDVWPGL